MRSHYDSSRVLRCFWSIYGVCDVRFEGFAGRFMFLGQDQLRAKEVVTCMRESNHHRNTNCLMHRASVKLIVTINYVLEATSLG